jgi:hypothetical protein
MPSVDESIALIGDLIAFPTVSRDSNKALLAYVEAYRTPRHSVRNHLEWRPQQGQPVGDNRAK